MARPWARCIKHRTGSAAEQGGGQDGDHGQHGADEGAGQPHEAPVEALLHGLQALVEALLQAFEAPVHGLEAPVHPFAELENHFTQPADLTCIFCNLVLDHGQSFFNDLHGHGNLPSIGRRVPVHNAALPGIRHARSVPQICRGAAMR